MATMPARTTSVRVSPTAVLALKPPAAPSDARRSGDDIKWSLLYLVIDAADEFTDDANADQLNAAKEKNNDDCGSPSASGVRHPHHLFHDEEHTKEKAAGRS